MNTVLDLTHNEDIMRLHIAKILRNFDFAEVHRTMTALDWNWADSSGTMAVPTVERLRDTVERLIVECYRNKYSNLGTGGFMVRYTEYDQGGSDIEVLFKITARYSRYNPKEET